MKGYRRSGLILALVIALAGIGLDRTSTIEAGSPTEQQQQRLSQMVSVPSVEATGGMDPTVAPRTATPVKTLTPPAAVRVSSGARTVKATGYCSCASCCGKSDGITASGVKASWGTLAAPRSYATGSRFTISGFGSKVFTVQDRGGAITGDRIDIWFPTHQQALDWGVRTVTLVPVQ